MHGIFAVDQVVDRLAVDDDLGRGKCGPREDRGGDTLEREAGSEVKGCDRQSLVIQDAGHHPRPGRGNQALDARRCRSTSYTASATLVDRLSERTRGDRIGIAMRRPLYRSRSSAGKPSVSRPKTRTTLFDAPRGASQKRRIEIGRAHV